MILLLGGTGETASIASSLAGRGFPVLVSTATDLLLDIGTNKNISRRTGRLSKEEMRLIIDQKRIRVVVDATHPYAEEITQIARAVAKNEGVPFFRFSRPGVSSISGQVHQVKDHVAAAKIAFNFCRPVFITTGSRNLAPYAAEASQTGIPLIVRVLSAPEAIKACKKAGIPSKNIIAGRGPFSLEDNITVIKKYGIGVLVTKDGGEVAGVPQKLEAARMTDCEVVLVARPSYEADSRNVWSDIPGLIDAVSQLLKK